MDNSSRSQSDTYINGLAKNIQKYLLENEYGKAFAMFLLHAEKMNSSDRDILIKHFNKYFTTYYTELFPKKHDDAKDVLL